jgi:hypothetical protein
LSILKTQLSDHDFSQPLPFAGAPEQESAGRTFQVAGIR